MKKFQSAVFSVLVLLLVAGCASLAKNSFDQTYGKPQPVERQVASLASDRVDYWSEVKPILDNRCVACHACFDAPCQLKTTAIEGIDRGASEQKVYDVKRLSQASPTRLFEDAFSTKDWREKGFFPVLNEYPHQSPELNLQASLLYRFLDLKKQHPLPNEKTLRSDFSLGLYRSESCTGINEFDSFAAKQPLWGMPYGLPGISDQDHNTLKRWVEQGAVHTPRAELGAEFKQRIDAWEALLNQNSIKARLISRYIYEHLFLANLYFDDLSERTFFTLVRSSTPPGVPIAQIATHRPYDDPKVDRVYYRLTRMLETVVAKTHKPYVLNEQRMDKWNTLFFEADFRVTNFPSYEPKVAGNPFVSFEQLPMRSRYKFLLDEAQFTIMNFVKGSVCRGQVAINVIRDRFWIFFLDPDAPVNDQIEDSIIQHQDDLELVSTQEDIYLPFANWVKYAAKERQSRKRRDEFLAENFTGKYTIDLKYIWDGDGENPNAALTVMRHFDYGSVEKGLLGEAPQTAWLISYPLLERIHYLLVAGYDVYGNLGHQLLSRVHMDFLRMDGEASFLTLLPQESRVKERNNWHRNAPKEANEFLANPEFEKRAVMTIPYKTNDHKAELFALLKDRLAPVLSKEFELDFGGNSALETTVKRLADFSGHYASLLPDTAVVRFHGEAGEQHYATIVKDVAHENMSSMFGENDRILAAETTVSVYNGVLGAYPSVMYRVPIAKAGSFVDQLMAMTSDADYESLIDNYGVRRTDSNFWNESDLMHAAAKKQSLVDYGIYDLNRYENR